MTRSVKVLFCLCIALHLGGCAQKRTLSPEQQEQVKQFVSTDAPKPQHELSIRFDDKVTLLGYDLSSSEFEVGKPLTVTWHYKVEAALPSGYKQFTHLADARGRGRVNLDQNGALRALFEPDLWQPQTYVRDEQVITLPDNWNSPKAVVYLGFWKGESRLPIKGQQDNERRARALELPVKGVQEAVPELRAAAVTAGDAKSGIKLDGKLDEAVWQTAQPTALFVNTMTGGEAEFRVVAKTAWDKDHLYVAFDVADDFLKSTFTQHDDHLWEQDCVEIMIDPDGDEKNYFELQVSPQGVAFDTHYDTRRNPKPFGNVNFDSGLKAGVDVRGKVNDDTADQGYTAEIAIPWAAFSFGEPKHSAPQAGDSWRLNFYVMDAREKGMRVAGWSPPLVGDFHVPNRFGKVVFEADPTQAAAEAAPASESTQVTAPAPAQGAAKKKAAQTAPAAP